MNDLTTLLITILEVDPLARLLKAQPPALLTSPQIMDLIVKKITTLLTGFPSYAQIRTVHLSWDS